MLKKEVFWNTIGKNAAGGIIMLAENILSYTLETIGDYTMPVIHKMVEKLVDDGIATRSEQEKDDKIYIGDVTEKSSLSYCIKKDNNLIKKIEEWEFDKNYKYSMYFTLSNCSKESFDKCLEQRKMLNYDKLTECEELHSVIDKPSLKVSQNLYYLKFNLKLDATNALGEELKKRYSVLAVFNMDANLMELRFDSIEAAFTRDKFKYAYSALEWIRRFIGATITAEDFHDEINYIRKHGKEKGIILSGQSMLMASGGKATVDIGNDNSQVLPFIGELKMIMEQHKEAFEKASEIKEALEKFIYEKENLSEFPWVKFKFGENNNTEIKFTYNYGKEKGCLLQHLHSSTIVNQGRGRMDYVTNSNFPY